MIFTIYILTDQYGLPAYVGQAIKPESRFSVHVKRSDFKVGGMAVLERCKTKAQANKAETKHMAAWREATKDSLWNVMETAWTVWPPEMKPVIRAKIGAASKRLWRSAPYREKVSAAVRAAKRTREARAKMSEQSTYRWRIPSFRLVMIEAIRRGLNTTQAHAKKSQSAIRAWRSPLLRAKMTAGMKRT